MRDSIKIILLSVLGLAAMAGLSACSSEQDDLEEWIAEVKKRPGGRIEPLPENSFKASGTGVNTVVAVIPA